MGGGDQEFQRLASAYRAMSDAELLRLLESRDGLTEVAHAALEQERARRGLELEPQEEPTLLEADSPLVAEGWAGLVRLSIAAEVDRAMRLLLAAEIPARLVDVRRAEGLDATAPVAFLLEVEAERAGEAKLLLRREMGLFPEAEKDSGSSGETSEMSEDDGFVVGSFASETDAHTAMEALSAAEIRCELDRTQWQTGDVPADERELLVLVSQADLERALTVLEQAFSVPDEA